MRKKILLRGPILSRSGYGEQARFAFRSLRKHEDRFDIYLLNTQWGQTGWLSDSHDKAEREYIDFCIQKTFHHVQNKQGFDMSLQVTIPNEWEKMTMMDIGYTAGIETTKIAPQWIEKSGVVDKIIVTSNHSKNVFLDTSYDVINKETKSLRLQKRVKTEINELNREIEAEEKRIAKEKKDREDAEFEAMMKANDEWNKQQLKDAEKLNDDLEKLDKAREEAKLNLIKQGFDIAGQLAGESDQAQKAVAVAKTIYNTQQAIMNAMANIPAPFNIATAVSTGIMGAMSVKNILSTSPSSTTNVNIPTSGQTGTPAPEMLSGSFTLGGTPEPEPIQAYVVTDSLTDNQNKLAYIRRRATI